MGKYTGYSSREKQREKKNVVDTKDLEWTARQLLAITYYSDRESETFGNANASAKKAGYAVSYARSRGGNEPLWLIEAKRRALTAGTRKQNPPVNINQAEKHISKMDEKYSAMIEGAEGNVSEFIDTREEKRDALRLRASMFALERLKPEVWSQKKQVEHSGQVFDMKAILIAMQMPVLPEKTIIEGESEEKKS